VSQDASPLPPSDPRSEEVVSAYLQALQAGRETDRQRLLDRFPNLAPELKAFSAYYDRLTKLDPGPTQAAAAAAATVPHPSRTEEPQPLPLDGTFGDYELLALIARGGMGVVYKARQISLNRTVAVKMVQSGEFASEEVVERFRTEAEAAANLQHANIVAIHEVGVHKGQHYFSMDYVEGHSLAALVSGKPLRPERAARYIQTVGEAIHYAHQKGVLHRDLKPSNVLIDEFDQPRITDFGLAKRIEGAAELTASGQVLGTPGYMPPEQISGARDKVGPASDIYSLGAALYELLTGRPPFEADTTLNTLMLVLDPEQEPERPRSLNRQIDRDLETICLKCLQKDPQKRYHSGKDLAEDLERYLEGEAILARPVGPLGHVVRWAKRNPAFATTLLALTAFYINHLTFLYVLNVPGQGGAYHRLVTTLVPIWALGAGTFQWLARSARWRAMATPGWVSMDVVLFTLLLMGGHGPRSSLLVCYPLLVGCAALRFRIGLVWYAMGICMASYLCLVAEALWHRPELSVPAHHSLVFVLSLAVTALILHLLLRRVRATQAND